MPSLSSSNCRPQNASPERSDFENMRFDLGFRSLRKIVARAREAVSSDSTMCGVARKTIPEMMSRSKLRKRCSLEALQSICYECKNKDCRIWL